MNLSSASAVLVFCSLLAASVANLSGSTDITAGFLTCAILPFLSHFATPWSESALQWVIRRSTVSDERNLAIAKAEILATGKARGFSAELYSAARSSKLAYACATVLMLASLFVCFRLDNIMTLFAVLAAALAGWLYGELILHRHDFGTSQQFFIGLLLCSSILLAHLSTGSSGMGAMVMALLAGYLVAGARAGYENNRQQQDVIRYLESRSRKK